MPKNEITVKDVREYMRRAVIALAANFEEYSSLEVSANHRDADKPPKVSFCAYNAHWGVSSSFDNPADAIADLVRISKTKKSSEVLREKADALLIQAKALEVINE